MTTLALDVVTDDRAVAALAPAWETLWDRVPDRSPFQSPAWLLPWWRQWGTGHPVIATLCDNARLLALLPAYVLDDGHPRRLLPMGAGISDYLDALVAPDAPDDAAERLVAAALAAAGDIAEAEFFDLPPGSALRHMTPPPGWRIECSEGNACPVLRLPAGVDPRAVIPAAQHRKLRMNRHRAARRGIWTSELANATTRAALFDELLRLHGARWAAQGEPGVLADPAVVAFHRDAGPILLDAGLLRLHALRCDGMVAAVVLALSAPPERLFLYLTGFDASFAFESPGTLLLGEIIESAASDGIREIHFLRGREGYKYAWGATDRLNAIVRFVRS